MSPWIVTIERVDRREEVRGILPFVQTKHVVDDTVQVYHQVVEEDLDLTAVISAVNRNVKKPA